MTSLPDYGFILTRHVNSALTNNYWNRCVQSIQRWYPYKQIIIIDDNSNYDYVSATNEDGEYSRVSVIQSEYPGRGELLPYVYYLRYRWFRSAVIIHDSVFIHHRFAFEQCIYPVLPLWSCSYDKENVHNILRIMSVLTNSQMLRSKIIGKDPIVLGMPNSNKFDLCFGGQTFIRLRFLEHVEQKYAITKMIHTVHNRPDRCALERVLGAVFSEEFPLLNKIHALFGNIQLHYKAFTYTYDDYIRDVSTNKIRHGFVKVWTGR